MLITLRQNRPKENHRKKIQLLASVILASSIFLVGSEAHSMTDTPPTELWFDNSLVDERDGEYRMAKYAGGQDDRNNNGTRDDKEIRYKVSDHEGFLEDSGLAADDEKDHAHIHHMPVLDKPAEGTFTYASTLAPKYVGPLHYGFRVAQKKDNPDDSNKKTVISSIEITDLTAGEVLDITAEVYFNRCSTADRDGSQGNDAPWSPCWNKGLLNDNGYDYDQINMHAAFFLGNTYDCVTPNCVNTETGASINSGNPIRISEWQTRDCDRNQHHCGLTLPRLKKTIGQGEERKYLLVVGYAEADDSNDVETYHQVELERRKHATGMSVTRFSESYAASTEPVITGTVTDDVQESAWTDIHGENAKYFDIFVEDIPDLEEGDVIIAEGAARFRTDMKSKDCDPLFKDFLVLTTRNSKNIDNPNSERKYHYEGDFHNEEAWIVSPNNYGNVRSDKSDGALIRKTGQVEVPSECNKGCTLRWVGTRFKKCATGDNKWLTKGTYDEVNESFMSYEVHRK